MRSKNDRKEIEMRVKQRRNIMDKTYIISNDAVFNAWPSFEGEFIDKDGKSHKGNRLQDSAREVDYDH